MRLCVCVCVCVCTLGGDAVTAWCMRASTEFAFGDRGFANLVPRAAHVVYRIQLKSIKRGRRLMCSIL